MDEQSCTLDIKEEFIFHDYETFEIGEELQNQQFDKKSGKKKKIKRVVREFFKND